MKKVVSVFLCVTILCAAAATCAETTANELFHFSPGLVSSAGSNAEEWTEGGLRRGMFTVFILLDYSVSLDGADAPFDLLETQNAFYVGKAGDVVSLMVIPGDLSCGLVLSYDVSTAEASGYLIDGPDLEAQRQAYVDSSADGFFQLDYGTDIVPTLSFVAGLMREQ